MKAVHVAWFSAAALTQLLGCTSEEQMAAEQPGQQDVEEQASTGEHARRDIDPDADALLRRMSDYLGGLQSFSVATDHTVEVVLDSGQKVQLVGKSDVSVRRPDKLRSDRKGEQTDMSFYYDGKTVSLLGKVKNLYAQANAPSTIDEMIDFARDKLQLDAPGADLLYSNPYDVLMENAISGKIVDSTSIRGIPCQHVAFHGKGVDYQLWIKDGADPVPLRYVITTTDVKSAPEYTVDMHDWNTSAALPDDTFAFAPPPGAERIEFVGTHAAAAKK